MNFPMIEDINKNTNAKAQETKDYMETVKEAILAALPEGGIEQSALDAAVDEIITAMPSQTATAQTKKFTNVVSGTASRTSTTISGSGYAIFTCPQEDPDHNAGHRLTVDGVSMADCLYDARYLAVYFEKSIVMKESTNNSSYFLNYIVMT